MLYIFNIQETVCIQGNEDSFILIIFSEKKHNLSKGKEHMY